MIDRLELKQGSWFQPVSDNKKFDVIISNPPYISTSDILQLDKTVRNYDPLQALDGGEDGLDCYREILQHSR